MSAFFAMGGYAWFVWPAYAVSAASLAAMVIATLCAYRRAKARAASTGDGTP